MSAGDRPTRPKIAPETGDERHYHVNDADFEISGDGTVLITAYEHMHGELRPQFFVTITPEVLATLARKALQTAGDAHNVSMFKAFLDEGGSSH